MNTHLTQVVKALDVEVASEPKRWRGQQRARATHTPSGVYCFGRGDTACEARHRALLRLCQAFSEGAIRPALPRRTDDAS